MGTNIRPCFPVKLLLLCFHQAACRWIFNTSSMKRELWCEAGWWRALTQPWSECPVLSVCPACPASLCMLCWVGNPAHRVIAQWDKQGRVSGLLMWEPSMFPFPGMKGHKRRHWKRTLGKVLKYWWPLWSIPAAFCLLLEIVSCGKHFQYAWHTSWLACCCQGFFLLDVLALAKYHCNRKSWLNPGPHPSSGDCTTAWNKEDLQSSRSLSCALPSHGSWVPLVFVNKFKWFQIN